MRVAARAGYAIGLFGLSDYLGYRIIWAVGLFGLSDYLAQRLSRHLIGRAQNELDGGWGNLAGLRWLRSWSS